MKLTDRLFTPNAPLSGVCDAPAKRYYWFLRVVSAMSGVIAYDWRHDWRRYLAHREDKAHLKAGGVLIYR